MTPTEINSLAERGAIAAVDAHGVENPPSAWTVYEFLREFDCDEGPEIPEMTPMEFRQFKHDYYRHLQLHGVSKFVATRAVFFVPRAETGTGGPARSGRIRSARGPCHHRCPEAGRPMSTTNGKV